MVKLVLKIAADLENLTNLQPQGGCDDPNFSYLFKLRCGNCGELSEKETCVSLADTVPVPHSKGSTNLVQKCKFCAREGTVTMIPGHGKPLTLEDSEAGKFVPLMQFDSRGYELVDFVFDGSWKVESVGGTKFEGVDLSAGEYAEYDEKGECPVMISNLRSTFDVVK
ncbi:hypothetical protein CCACVL1_20934 [Corchorus capsularis]|uniref:CXXC motif containing zinc binding protein n=1 Tax=Corchorus capsularis TaxID=210143 RepID=A0A1R3H9A2_COCAP|nr:hypothetical protein CCACVL1_20934 [Corchorus capsularis]